MNRLPGEIVKVDAAGSVALVEVAVGRHHFTATLVGSGEEAAAWPPGMGVTLLFKGSEMSLAKNLSGMISLRNRLPGTIRSIERGSLLARVMLDFEGHALESIITARSCDAMQLAVGDQVEGLVKANEMSLLPGEAA
ncbi:molybdate transport system regulatory protein [Noviherbaspirillum humi]|uniref:Molybdate transport system regulatory protein n=1 Tax=Noviherbaspirillum humi TaxID=1688639 RepID=A0A239EAJ8_9BURK|nr:TOBE domain-containing protein [Noviherbaspirillum humi]SNS41491.1 molybdate transport system regulatory protein [Noviherbaspirillum humi]